MIKIVVTGSESTGKTELARRLGTHFGAPVSKEFVRQYVAQREQPLGFADHGPIAKGQIAAEDDAIARARDLVILDTDLVSTVVYCEHYFGLAPEWIEAEARARAGQIYLLLEPDIPWQPDGIRDRGDRRDEMHQLFRNKLQHLRMRFVEIGGDGNARFHAAVRVIESEVFAR